ncbi:hypothetical protein GUITHDRAFT_145577 [Guillardia theta CCMP2712]|uniref:Uncharacterized protein n=1 Tax=Guillardia theta (strain CCMP2712) TaxID=905079 RepID=L1ILE0_GUITC|nr:hypothetical protein GUITHDRAFT_145577 [Guillardia theta CCMP2712]EKX36615.1 hypothetical protein GUITHDRAFT_145577 [Guillardia theta CCMP2712]|eukprot:XP_005823595.1 hypothetical protein GUITHDRAFT_145577 [Guillardia theta CCMP2712]
MSSLPPSLLADSSHSPPCSAAALEAWQHQPSFRELSLHNDGGEHWAFEADMDVLSSRMDLLSTNSSPRSTNKSDHVDWADPPAMSLGAFRERQLKALAYCIDLLSQDDPPTVYGATGDKLHL